MIILEPVTRSANTYKGTLTLRSQNISYKYDCFKRRVPVMQPILLFTFLGWEQERLTIMYYLVAVQGQMFILQHRCPITPPNIE